jgi:hypothetical protein
MFKMIPMLLLVPGGFAVAADNPHDLQAEMTKVESAYVALYDRLNTDHQYDVVCRNERATGSVIQTRVCQPRYVVTSREEATSTSVRNMLARAHATGSSSGSQSVEMAGTSRDMNVTDSLVGKTSPLQLSKEQAFRQNMLDVTRKSPELQALGKQLDDLQARYDAATKVPGSR